jgi:hypothetical protein
MALTPRLRKHLFVKHQTIGRNNDGYQCQQCVVPPTSARGTGVIKHTPSTTHQNGMAVGFADPNGIVAVATTASLPSAAQTCRLR